MPTNNETELRNPLMPSERALFWCGVGNVLVPGLLVIGIGFMAYGAAADNPTSTIYGLLCGLVAMCVRAVLQQYIIEHHVVVQRAVNEAGETIVAGYEELFERYKESQAQIQELTAIINAARRAAGDGPKAPPTAQA